MTKERVEKVELEDLLEKSVEKKDWREWYREPDWRNLFKSLALFILTIVGYVYLGFKKIRHKKTSK